MLPLLAADEPAAVTVLRADGRFPLVLACDHASPRIPRALGSLGLSAAQLATHIACDRGAAGVARRLSERLDAPLVLQNYSRLVIDCNRPPDSPESVAVRSESTPIAGNEGLSLADVAARRAALFTPYHEALRAILDRGAPVSGAQAPALLAVHSFTPVYQGVSRPWHAGIMYLRDSRLGRQLLAGLRLDARLHVGENEPYATSEDSDYTVIVHGERRGIAYAGLEIRDDLISDEDDQDAWAARLAPLIQACCGTPSTT